jgi:hypothetical protein
MSSLNVCNKNEGMEARNNTKSQRYITKMMVWSRYLQTKKAAKDNGDPSLNKPMHNGKQIKRKPCKPGAHNLEVPMV